MYNAPTTSKVFAIWVDDEPSENIGNRDISISSHSASKHRVPYYFACYDPLQ